MCICTVKGFLVQTRMTVDSLRKTFRAEELVKDNFLTIQAKKMLMSFVDSNILLFVFLGPCVCSFIIDIWFHKLGWKLQPRVKLPLCNCQLHFKRICFGSALKSQPPEQTEISVRDEILLVIAP